jgi:hypothetical protein
VRGLCWLSRSRCNWRCRWRCRKEQLLAEQLLFGQLSGAVPAPAARGARRSSLLDSYITDTSPPQIPSAALRPFALGLLGAAAERPVWFSFFPECVLLSSSALVF